MPALMMRNKVNVGILFVACFLLALICSRSHWSWRKRVETYSWRRVQVRAASILLRIFFLYNHLSAESESWEFNFFLVVCRYPNHKELFCAIIGNGAQLLCMCIGILFLACLGVYRWARYVLSCRDWSHLHERAAITTEERCLSRHSSFSRWLQVRFSAFLGKQKFSC